MRRFFETYSTAKIAAKGAGTFEFKPFPDESGHSEAVINMIDGLWVAIDRFVEEATSIRNDRRFSDVGKAEAIDPKAMLVYRAWLETAAGVDAFSAIADATEKALIGAPEPHPQNLVAHFRAQEIRQYWRGLDMSAKGDILRSLNVDNHRELALAMLQSPLPLDAMEDKAFRDTWANACREADPVTAEKISLSRASVEWANRALALALVAIKQQSGWTDQRALNEILEFTNPAYADKDLIRLGFSREAIAHARMRKQNGR